MVPYTRPGGRAGAGTSTSENRPHPQWCLGASNTVAPRRHSRPSPTLNSPIAVKQEAVEDARLALALQKPEMELTNDGAGAGTIEVSFVTGPQAFAGTYSIACYAVGAPAPAPTCSTLADFTPIAPAESGDLAKTRSKIEATFTEVAGVAEDVERACFITVEGAFEKMDKCKELVGAYPAAPPPPARSAETDDRLAGAILKPEVAPADGAGEGLITFESLDLVDYTYTAYCFDVAAMEAADPAVALPTCKDDLADVDPIYVVTTGAVENVPDENKEWQATVTGTPDSEVLCFVTAEGPYEKKTTCKSAGTAILTAGNRAASDERLAGAIVKPKVTAVESIVQGEGAGEITFETYGVSAYEITATCFDVALLPDQELLSCKDSADFLDAEYDAARAAVTIDAQQITQTVEYGKTTIGITAVLDTEVQCFLQAVGPFGEFESCKSAGTAVLDLVEPAP